jgi:hypothetical protein
MNKEMSEFEQKATLALLSNVEFVKSAVDGYDHKHVGYCIAEQVALTLRKLNNQ